ncbi:MAG: 4'-phosphopantetheinyl transferase superfamily protein [Nitrosospira sp.]|nr:4'-phosphopantetheinyl transferase superfamily protein [Nitrosospira sp.]
MSRAALRRMLALRLGILPDELRFVTNRYGKPRLHEDSGIEFNISHAGRFVLIALSSRGKVGVDIESRDRGKDAENLAPYVFTSIECRTRIQTAENFVEHWVAKESVLKALGLGISEHLQSVSILPGDGGGYEIAYSRPEWSGIRVWRIEAPDGYVAAIALQCPVSSALPGRHTDHQCVA